MDRVVKTRFNSILSDKKKQRYRQQREPSSGKWNAVKKNPVNTSLLKHGVHGTIGSTSPTQIIPGGRENQ